MKGLAQENKPPTSYNSAFMSQFVQMNATMNAMQDQLKNLYTTSTNTTRTKRKFYCWSCGSNLTNGSKIWYSKKTGHKEEVYYKKIIRGIEKGCEWKLGAIMNKIKISTPKTSSINNTTTPPNYPSNNTLEIEDSGTNIHLDKQATPKMAQVIISKDTAPRLPDGSTMELSHIATLQLPVISKKSRQIKIIPKMRTVPLISLGFLCDYGCTITLYQ